MNLFLPSDLFDCFYERILPAAQCDRSKEIGIRCSEAIGKISFTSIYQLLISLKALGQSDFPAPSPPEIMN